MESINKAISIEHLSKQYELGVIGTGTLSRDLNRWWARLRKQPDPYTRIGQQDSFARIGETILALDDVSFSVYQGEVLGIIGRNGAGKSTLLKILSRVTAPTSGVLKVKGRIGSLLEVGTGFHPELTGRENVYLNGSILGMNKAEVARKFDEIVDFAGVEKFIDTPVKRYSSGMYVRLAFAVAAHLESEILIVDEVLAVGDSEFQKKCLGKMGEVSSKEGRTVLFVSHNMTAIKNLCNRCILLENGEKRFEGETEEVVSNYLEDKIISIQISPLERLDRTGSGEIKFDFFMTSQKRDGENSDKFYTGDSLFITARLISKVKANVFFAFQIKDKLENTITSFNSREGGFIAPIQKGMNTIVVHVPFLALLEGKYSIDAACVDSSTFVAYDRINHIALISVGQKDIFNSGAAFGSYHGVVLLTHIWQMEKMRKYVIAAKDSLNKY